LARLALPHLFRDMNIDRLIRTKRKSIALIVEHDGSLTVRAPLRVSNKQILALVEQKAGWIRSKQELVMSMPSVSHTTIFANGAPFWYLGKVYPLEITPEAVPPLQLDGKFFLAQTIIAKGGAVFTNWYKKQAAQVIGERVRWYAAKHEFVYKHVRITSAQKRWGSCSARDTLCFTWRLMMAPPAEIDYVVVHELVHLAEKNHSKAFWAKVEAIMPDYKERRKWLKQNGHLLSMKF
jgi:predicted metal-dependent hydrolase